MLPLLLLFLPHDDDCISHVYDHDDDDLYVCGRDHGYYAYVSFHVLFHEVNYHGNGFLWSARV